MIDTSPRPNLTAVLIALGAAFLLSLIVIIALSGAPGDAVYFFFVGPFLSRYHTGNLLDGATLLMMTGLGITLAFRGGAFNLGGEGQSYLGALVASQLALAPALTSLPSVISIPAVLAVSAIAAAAVASFSGLLRAGLAVDELITSFLVSSALLPIIDYAVGGPLRDPQGYLLATRLIPGSLRFTHFAEPSTLNSGLILALALAVVAHLAIRYTLFGYELRMTGGNKRFARYAGIRTRSYLVVSMAASGLLHGLAGGLYVLGTRYMCVQGGTAGIGWNGIAVALIAENRPLAAIPAALVFSYLSTATETAMLNTGFSFELSALIQAAVFLLITVRRWGGRR